MKELVARREQWCEELDCVRRMHGWVVEAEAILSGSWATAQEAVTNAAVAVRFDAFICKLKDQASTQVLSESE